MDGVWVWAERNPGDVATWVGAIGTLLAFFAVVVPLLWQRRAARAAKRRAQAEQVAAWFEGLPRRDPFHVEGRVGPATLVLRNASQMPVYEVAVEYRLDDSAVSQQDGQPYSEDRFRKILWVELLPPGEWVVHGDLMPSWQDGSVAVSFVDSSGTYWKRKKDFQLQELRRPPLESYGIDPSHHAREQVVRRPS